MKATAAAADNRLSSIKTAAPAAATAVLSNSRSLKGPLAEEENKLAKQKREGGLSSILSAAGISRQQPQQKRKKALASVLPPSPAALKKFSPHSAARRRGGGGGREEEIIEELGEEEEYCYVGVVGSGDGGGAGGRSRFAALELNQERGGGETVEDFDSFPGSPSLWRKAQIINKFMSLTSPTLKRKGPAAAAAGASRKSNNSNSAAAAANSVIMTPNRKKPVQRLAQQSTSLETGAAAAAAAGARKKLPLIPRRDFDSSRSSSPSTEVRRMSLKAKSSSFTSSYTPEVGAGGLGSPRRKVLSSSLGGGGGSGAKKNSASQPGKKTKERGEVATSKAKMEILKRFPADLKAAEILQRGRLNRTLVKRVGKVINTKVSP